MGTSSVFSLKSAILNFSVIQDFEVPNYCLLFRYHDVLVLILLHYTRKRVV